MNFYTIKCFFFLKKCSKTILIFCIFFKNIFMENFFSINFFIESYYIKLSLIFELLPELIIIYYILYSLISIFNDSTKSIYHYYRWFIFYIIIFFTLLWKIVYFSWISTKIILNFSLINCFYTIFSKLIIISLTILILWISKNKLENSMYLNCIIEFPLIISFSLLFMFFLTSGFDFFGIYLSIEGLSLTLYVLSAILYQSIVSIEATLKYFSTGAISTGVFLFGISIIFCIIGSLDFLEVQLFLGNFQILSHFIEIKVGFLFILVGLLFKISAFPFHIWIADVYEGIWTPITAFFAITVKVCLVLFFIRITFNVMFNILFCFQTIISFSSIGSMTIGLFNAIKQVKIKRFIAYTSINQIGFILLGIASCNLIGLISCIIYIILYAIMSLIFFTILLNTEHLITKKNMSYLSDLYSFSMYNNKNSKYLVLTILSMAGLPPLGGFIGKLFLYLSAIEARLDIVILASLILSVISVYYYLSFIRYILFEKLYNFKLYYYIKKKNFDILLLILSSVLLLFIIILPNVIIFSTSLALSCMQPFVFY